MPNPPLDALKKAQTIQAAPPADAEWARTALDTGVQGLLGAIGLGDDSSLVNRGGQLVGAALPVVGGVRKAITRETHPAVQALIELLSGEPAAVNPDKLAAMSRVTPHFVPPPPKLEVPEGFKLSSIPPPPRPKTFQEASIAQEGFPGGFGRSPGNDMLYHQQQEGLKRLEKLDASTLPQAPLSGRWAGRGNIEHGWSRQGAAILNPNSVREIRSAFDNGKSIIQISNDYKMNHNTIRAIIKGDSWGWVK